MPCARAMEGKYVRRLTRHNILIFVSLALAALVFTGCGGSGPEPGPTVAPADLVNQAASAMEQVRSAHFALDVEGQQPTTEFVLQVTRAEGDAVAPDRLKAKVTARLGQSPLETELVVIGQEKFLKNPLSGKFEPQTALPGSYAILDKDRGAPRLLRNLQNPTLGGRESVDGVECDVVSGTLNAADLTALFGDNPVSQPVKTQVWISTTEKQVRRVRLSGPIANGEPESIERTITLSAFNQDVTVERPS